MEGVARMSVGVVCSGLLISNYKSLSVRGGKQYKNEMRIFIVQLSNGELVIYFENQTNPNQYCMTRTVIPRHDSCVLWREILQMKAIIKEIRE
jgi:hypothetical protein